MHLESQNTLDVQTAYLNEQYVGWDWDSLKNIWLPEDPYRPESELYYKKKYAVANLLKPKSIAEIGVRAGYSAYAFLMVKSCEKYKGYDLNEGTWGGQVDFINHAKRLLTQSNIDWNITQCDTQTLETIDCGPCDLFHVDGDHSFAGCMHDIELAVESESTWILVDDFDFIKEVKEAVVESMFRFGVKRALYIPDDGYRGNMLFLNPKSRGFAKW